MTLRRIPEEDRRPQRPDTIRVIPTAALTAAAAALLAFVLMYHEAALWAMVVALVLAVLGLFTLASETVDLRRELYDADRRAEDLEAETQRLAGDYDAVVKRLAEVLDEHALCPAPVRVTGPACPACEGWNPVSGVRTRETAGLVCQTCGWDYAKGEKPRRTLRALASGPVPQQRDGSES